MNLKYISVSMANCYFAEPHGMKHCYIPFFMLLISNALLVLARHRVPAERACFVFGVSLHYADTFSQCGHFFGADSAHLLLGHGRTTEVRHSLRCNGPRCPKAISTTLCVFRSRDCRVSVPTLSIRSGAEIALSLRNWRQRLLPYRRPRIPSAAW
jgi:hypothetical protein